MRTADLAPLYAELLTGVLLSTLGLGDKGDFLSAVEIGVGLGIDILDLDQRDVLVLIPLSALVPQDGSFDKEAGRTLGSGCLGHLHERSE